MGPGCTCDCRCGVPAVRQAAREGVCCDRPQAQRGRRAAGRNRAGGVRSAWQPARVVRAGLQAAGAGCRAQRARDAQRQRDRRHTANLRVQERG